MRTSVDSVLDKVVDGGRLESRELGLLFDNAPLLALGQAADTVRRRTVDPETVTYIIDRNINYTNICVYSCRFCAFSRSADADDAYLLSFESIAEKVAETVAAGGTGVLLQGGVHPKLKLEDYEDLLRHLKTSFPHVHLHAFSAPEIWYISKLEGLALDEVIGRLKDAGLQSIPGGGAEILEDETRRRIGSQSKVSTRHWLAVHEAAHRQELRTTATMMFAVGEPFQARIYHLLAIRDLQDRTGGFTAFIPWTFQDANTELEGGVETAGGFDYLRTLAISRLALDNITHVQGSWVTQGAKIGQLSLYFGADDLGSIMLEENVVAAAGVQFRMTQREMERVISEGGFKPQQRRTLYERI